MKIPSSLHLLTVAAALVAAPVFAQSNAMLSADETGALLGQTYSGVEFGYTRHREGPPDVLHRYGFVSSKPMVDFTDVDGAFRYDYTRGGHSGLRFNQHDVMIGLTRYVTSGQVKPYVHADIGWLWQKAGATREDSFVYRLGAGAEFMLKPRVSLTPFFNYRDARQVEQRSWNFGAKLGVRPNRTWSWSLTLQSDDEHNIEFAAGAQRRF